MRGGIARRGVQEQRTDSLEPPARLLSAVAWMCGPRAPRVRGAAGGGLLWRPDAAECCTPGIDSLSGDVI